MGNQNGQDRLAWFREAKFGMFIHWGLYALPAGVWKGQRVPGVGEWIMHRARIPVREYEELAKLFDPIKFNAKEWAQLAKEAGMRYMVITAKHHDGFSMFDSKVTDYDIVDATPFGRDPMEELARACREEGIRFGFYYSHVQDWHDPDANGNDWDYDPSKKNFARYFEGKAMPQVRELLTQYGPIAIIWYDTPQDISREHAEEARRVVRELQPDCLINGRIGHDLGDYREMGDNLIPEGVIPDPWETPATLNDTWGYKSYDHNWKSVGVLIHKLVDIVSKGGNYLLNVGPTAEGVIPEPSAERLRKMGQWLQVNGESIYGASPSPVPLEKFDLGRCTAKPGKIFVHVFAWPWEGTLVISGITQAVRRAFFLATGETLSFRQTREAITIQVPRGAPDPIDTVVVLEVG